MFIVKFGNRASCEPAIAVLKRGPDSPCAVAINRGGEGRNRTYLGPVNEPPTVLKTMGATRHPSLSDESNCTCDAQQKDKPVHPRRTPQPVVEIENMLRQTDGPRLVESFFPVHKGILSQLKRASQEASLKNCQVFEARSAPGNSLRRKNCHEM